MRSSIVLVLISLLQTPSCDLTGGPAKVQKQAEIQLRQYFPNSHVVVSPKQGTIFAMTCTRGLGKPVIEEIVKNVENSRGIQQLHEARQFPLKLSPYRFFVLAFDEYCIHLDTDTKQHWIASSDSPAHIEYQAACGIDPAAAFKPQP